VEEELVPLSPILSRDMYAMHCVFSFFSVCGAKKDERDRRNAHITFYLHLWSSVKARNAIDNY
jgi:hypothetical protein